MSASRPSGDRSVNASAIAGWGLFLVIIAAAIGVLVLGRGLDAEPVTGGGGSSATTRPEGTTTSSSAAPATTTTSTLPPDSVLVQVANGAGVSGAAGRVTDQLAEDGFQTATPVNADNSGYATSEVYYAADQQAAAQTVAAALGVPVSGALASPAPTTDGAVADGIDVLVVVGKDLATGTTGGGTGATTTGSSATTTG